MKLIENIKKIGEGKFYDEDEEIIEVKLLPGLNAQQILALKKQIPQENMPTEVSTLLEHTAGLSFEYYFMDEISFTDFGPFGFNQLIPFCLTLTGDGAGNFWLIDISSNGEWGSVYFVCHDPALIVKQAENITEFIHQLHNELLSPSSSLISEISDQSLMEIYKNTTLLKSFEDVMKSGDSDLQSFASQFDEDWFFGDLRKAKIGEGFSLVANYSDTIRHDDELIWAMKKPKSILSKFKNLFK
ncbi:MAG: SMI1/KNR4 family protein [Bacteroidota bacterium]